MSGCPWGAECCNFLPRNWDLVWGSGSYQLPMVLGGTVLSVKRGNRHFEIRGSRIFVV